MEIQETMIELLKRNIGNNTRKERVQIINEKIKNFDDYGRQHSYNVAESIFGTDFLKKAKSLIKEIETDKSIAYNRDWNWFFNADNIPNQTAVFATKDFLEIERKDVFDSLYFFNLLFKQKDELKDNLDIPFDYVKNLKNLSLTELQKYILLGMILYWHGGYPVNNFNPKYDTILKLIEREFLKMNLDETPEKGFCQGDLKMKARLKELEITINENLNASGPFVKTEKSDIQTKGYKFSGKKIDLIRILNALYELKQIKNVKDQIPTKESFMKEAGAFFGFDLSKYDVDLSQAFSEGKTEKNTVIFDKMKEVIEKQIQEKL